MLHLQQTFGAPPRLATARFLDEVGAATKRLEDALGSPGLSPVRRGDEGVRRGSAGLTSDVEANYKESLR